jgi:hypothetical protein
VQYQFYPALPDAVAEKSCLLSGRIRSLSVILASPAANVSFYRFADWTLPVRDGPIGLAQRFPFGQFGPQENDHG